MGFAIYSWMMVVNGVLYLSMGYSYTYLSIIRLVIAWIECLVIMTAATRRQESKQFFMVIYNHSIEVVVIFYRLAMFMVRIYAPIKYC